MLIVLIIVPTGGIASSFNEDAGKNQIMGIRNLLEDLIDTTHVNSKIRGLEVGKEYAHGELIVKFSRGDVASLADDFPEGYGMRIKKTLGLPGYAVIEISGNQSVWDAIDALKEHPLVEFAEPNYVAKVSFVPNDPHYPLQWHFHQIQMESAWEKSNGSSVTVAVLDTGVAYEDYGPYRLAPDLAGTVFVQGYDFVNDDAHPNDDNYHGTHVTGTLAQTTNNNLGVAGIAYGAKVMPLKACDAKGDCKADWLMDGIVYAADHDADIISISLGGFSHSAALEEAIKYAYDEGVTLIAAAGNDNTSEKVYPAAYDDVIAVGATRYDQTKAPYSNYGSWIDLVAPGGDLHVDQNGDGQPDGILQQTFSKGRYGDFKYFFGEGTSSATPHVSGVAALLKSYNPTLTPSDIRRILIDTAKDLGEPGKDDIYGYGLIQAADALAYMEVLSDLLVEDVWIDPPAPMVGDMVTFHAKIHNVGGLGVENFTVETYLDGERLSQDFLSLDAGEEAVLTASQTWVALEGDHTLRCLVDPDNRVLESNEGNNERSLTFKVQALQVVVDNSLVTEERADVGSTQTVYFHASWVHNGSALRAGVLYVNNKAYTTNSTGWIEFRVSSMRVARETWTITGVSVGGVATAYQQTAPDPSVIWDRVWITLSVEDDRINVGENASISYRAKYQYDDAAFLGSIALSEATIKHSPGVYRFTVSSIKDLKHGLSSFVSNDVYVVFDSVSIDIEVVDRRINVSENATIRVKGIYDSDGSPFDGDIKLNNTVFRRDGIGREAYTATALSGDSYGITVIGKNDVEYVIWDRVAVTLVPGDERIDVGSNASILWKAAYEYDDTVFVGSIILNETTMHEGVGKRGYRVLEIRDEKHGLSAFTTNEVSIIFDEVEVFLSTADGRLEVGRNATLSWEGRYAYDNEPFAGDVVLSEETTKPKKGRYSYTIKEISDPRYGLARFKANSLDIIFDRIVLEREIVTTTPGIITMRIRLQYEFDGQPVEDAVVTVDEAEASYLGGGTYRAVLPTLSPMLTLSIGVEKVGFSHREVEVSVLAHGNMALELVMISVVVAVAIIIVSRRRGTSVRRGGT